VAVDDILAEINTARAKLMPSQLPLSNFMYKFSLTVTDCLGRQATATKTYDVFKSAQPVPSVSITPAQKEIQVTETVRLKATLQFSKCAGKQSLSYTWGVISAFNMATSEYLTTLPTLAGITQANSDNVLELNLASGVLSSGYQYTFQLMAYPESDSTLSSVAKAVLTTKLPEVKAGIKGGSKVTDTTGNTIVIDGGDSQDPAGLAIEYEWSCKQLPSTTTAATIDITTGGKPCRDATGALLSFNTTDKVTLPPGTLTAPSGDTKTYLQFNLNVKGA